MLIGKKNNIFLSIIIPFYNSKNFLINSILHAKKINEEIKNVEIIYINDGSSDIDNILLKKKFKKLINIKLYNLRKNTGPGIARNLGIRKSKGKKIIFLDIEDRLELRNLISLINYTKIHDGNIFYNYKVFPKNKNFFNLLPIQKSNVAKCKHYLNVSCDKAVIFTCFERKFLIKNKIFFKKGFHEDIFFMFKVYYFSKGKILKFDKIIYLKYDHSNSITGKFRLKNLKDIINAWKQVFNFIKNKRILGIKNNLQFRLRGEYVNLFSRISLVKKSNLKFEMQNYLNNKLLTIIKKKYIVKTYKDKLFKKYSNR